MDDAFENVQTVQTMKVMLYLQAATLTIAIKLGKNVPDIHSLIQVCTLQRLLEIQVVFKREMWTESSVVLKCEWY